MDIVGNLLLGLGVALSPGNLAFCFVGALLGTMIGVLPGLGPVATIAVLLPITFSLPPEGGLIMLAGIFYGAQYGGSTTAILLNLPGEVSSVATAIDGYQMARQGRGGVALATAALGSFFAGCVATLLVALCGPLLIGVAMNLGPADYFSIMVAGLIAAIAIASGSVVKAIAMILVGLLLGSVGVDINSGAQRMTFGFRELSEGIDFAAMTMGLFGIAEILTNLRNPEHREVIATKINSLVPSRSDIRRAAPATVRGTIVGSIAGLVPGAGASLGAFASYMVEKRVSRRPEEFGHGAIEGVAGPESANNASAQTSFIPLLSLGIPSNAVMAVMVGAMIVHGIAPGPLLMEQHPNLFWGLIVSMWIGNLMLVIINLPLIGIWVKLLTVPYRLMFPAILIFCAVGAYGMNMSYVDVLVMAAFGLIGFGLRKVGFELAPLILGFVLGPMMEENLRRAMLISRGDPTVLLTRPISATFLLIAAALLLMLILPAIRKGRETIFAEDET